MLQSEQVRPMVPTAWSLGLLRLAMPVVCRPQSWGNPALCGMEYGCRSRTGTVSWSRHGYHSVQFWGDIWWWPLRVVDFCVFWDRRNLRYKEAMKIKRGWLVKKGCYRIGENGCIPEKEQPWSTIPRAIHAEKPQEQSQIDENNQVTEIFRKQDAAHATCTELCCDPFPFVYVVVWRVEQ
jgi:hypothetical protein